mgnify:CR=1 FL=1
MKFGTGKLPGAWELAGKSSSATRRSGKLASRNAKKIAFEAKAGRLAILDRQQGRCAYCFVKMQTRGRRMRDSATIDHVLPMVRGGRDSAENRVVACHACNGLKGSMTAIQYITVLWYLLLFTPDTPQAGP